MVGDFSDHISKWRKGCSHTIQGGVALLWYYVPGILSRYSAHLPLHAIPLDRFFNEQAITKRIVSFRVKNAKRRRDQHFLFSLNVAHPNPSKPKSKKNSQIYVEDLLPSRRKWSRPTKFRREHLSPQQSAERSILSSIYRARIKNEKAAWLKRLDDFISTIISASKNSKKIEFSAPNITLLDKDKSKKTYRPLATFNLRDRIIIATAADHLRQTIDRVLSKSSYAFRTRQKNGSPPPTHHDAVEALRSYIVSHNGKLFVAECDIQKFFDSVSHSVARDQLLHLLKKTKRNGTLYDRRLLHFFDAYLSSYSFHKNVKSEEKKLLKGSKAGGSIPWVEQELKELYSGTPPDQIGVPQGGALSPIIANIVLNFADEAVQRAADTLGISDYFYARYCDDMILVSPSRENTEALYDAYLQALKHLKLPFHPPELVTNFSKSFFNFKSKKTYGIGAPKSAETVPWIAFLGYHVRHDGRLRVRKSSLEKEILKQLQFCRLVVGSIHRDGVLMRAKPRQALHRARLHLHAMSVGSSALHTYGPKLEHELCWVSGFILLKKYPHVSSQLRRLDRTRRKNLVKLERKLKNKVDSINTLKSKKHKTLKYYGRPFSYYGQFHGSPPV